MLGANTYATITNHHVTKQNSLMSWVEGQDHLFYRERIPA